MNPEENVVLWVAPWVRPEPDLRDLIIRELEQALKHLGAKSDLLCIVCSYGETLPDELVLSELRYWNRMAAPETAVMTQKEYQETIGESLERQIKELAAARTRKWDAMYVRD